MFPSLVSPFKNGGDGDGDRNGDGDVEVTYPHDLPLWFWRDCTIKLIPIHMFCGGKFLPYMDSSSPPQDQIVAKDAGTEGISGGQWVSNDKVHCLPQVNGVRFGFNESDSSVEHQLLCHQKAKSNGSNSIQATSLSLQFPTLFWTKQSKIELTIITRHHRLDR